MMITNTVIELFPYSFEYLHSTLCLDEASINKLLALNMLRRLSKLDKIEIHDLLNEEADEVLKHLDGSIYVFRFVGIISIKQSCIISYPKYTKGLVSKTNVVIDKNYEIIREVINVIKKYDSVEQKQEIETKTGEYNSFNVLAYILELLDDYNRYGLYSNQLETIECNGNGNILWDKTIAEQPMYLSQGTPVYLDYYTDSSTINYSDFVRRLHAAILTYCTKELAPILKIVGGEQVFLSDENIEDFGDSTYILYRLHQEYTRQFETRKQKVINKLIEFISKQQNDYDEGDLSFVGTNSMNMVWEKVCATVLGDCRKRTLSSLNLQYVGMDANTTRIEDLMPKPLWVNSDGKSYTENDTLILDLIVIDKDRIQIFDAKYYNISFGKNKVKNKPGIGDITKQYLYEKAYVPLAEQNNIKITRNAFLMPTAGDKIKKVGYVSLELFKSDNLNDIEIILLPARQMYGKYLSM